MKPFSSSNRSLLLDHPVQYAILADKFAFALENSSGQMAAYGLAALGKRNPAMIDSAERAFIHPNPRFALE